MPTLPDTPGVYIFKSANRVIYVGKANNLRIRIGSYFRPAFTLGPKTSLMVSKITTLDFIKVNSEIEALLLESRLIKKFKPPYNIISKDDKSPYYIHISDEEFPRPFINHIEKGSVSGPFINSLIPKRILRHFRHIAPYCLSKRPVNKPCFYYHLGLCNPCPGDKNLINLKLLYHRNIALLKRLLRGNFSKVASSLRQQMRQASLKYEYEKAALYKDYLSSLSYLLSVPVNPQEYLNNPNLIDDRDHDAVRTLQNNLIPYLSRSMDLSRIEAYDASHLKGNSATAAMVVAVNGRVSPNNYRHFFIRYSKPESDSSMLSEIIIRRFKRHDWPLPGLVVLDGGKVQLSAIKNNFDSIPGNIPFIALSKPDKSVYLLKNGQYQKIQFSKTDSGLLLLERLTAEAHRFCRRLHHKSRAKIVLT